MDVKITVTVHNGFIRQTFEPGKHAPGTEDIMAGYKTHTLYIATDQEARDKVKDSKGLDTDSEVLQAVFDDVLESIEFVRWLK